MSEQQEALTRVLADYAWLVRSMLGLCETAETGGGDVVRIAQVRAVIKTTMPLSADIDAALTAATSAEAGDEGGAG